MNDLRIFRIQEGLQLPELLNSITAGFPSPAQDYLESPIDLTSELVADPASTFIGQITSSQLEAMEMYEGDLVIIESKTRPRPGDIVVILLGGELLVRYLRSMDSSGVSFSAKKTAGKMLRAGTDEDLRLLGVITYVIHRRLKRKDRG